MQYNDANLMRFFKIQIAPEIMKTQPEKKRKGIGKFGTLGTKMNPRAASPWCQESLGGASLPGLLQASLQSGTTCFRGFTVPSNMLPDPPLHAAHQNRCVALILVWTDAGNIGEEEEGLTLGVYHVPVISDVLHTYSDPRRQVW